MIKLCIFDLDGTLLNTLPTITYYLNLTLESFGFSKASEEACRGYVGDGARKLISRALADRGCTDEAVIDRVLDSYKTAYDEAPLYLTEAYEGIDGLLRELRALGVTLAVLSNKPHSATRPIVQAYFADTFSVIQGASDGLPLKPAPDGALAILGELGVKAEDTAFVGDTNVDILTGRAMGAGMSVGVLWGFRSQEELAAAGASAVINRPSELLRLLSCDGI